MNNIQKILEKKRNGIDCTEQESAEIKGWLTETVIFLQSDDIPTLNEIQELFPLEYGECEEEDERLNH